MERNNAPRIEFLLERHIFALSVEPVGRNFRTSSATAPPLRPCKIASTFSIIHKYLWLMEDILQKILVMYSFFCYHKQEQVREILHGEKTKGTGCYSRAKR